MWALDHCSFGAKDKIENLLKHVLRESQLQATGHCEILPKAGKMGSHLHDMFWDLLMQNFSAEISEMLTNRTITSWKLKTPGTCHSDK